MDWFFTQKKTKQYKNQVHTSTKLTPLHASLKKNEGYVFRHLLDKRIKVKPKIQVKDLLRVADLRKTFSRGDTTNWSYKKYKISQFINETIASYRIDNLPERYIEALLKKTDLSMEENDGVMKNLKIT